MITEEDRNNIAYFIKEKGDIERWVNWEERKEDIEAEYPELIAAIKQVEIAERTLAAIVEKISSDI